MAIHKATGDQKSVVSGVRNKKKNLITIWLDYKKAFDLNAL